MDNHWSGALLQANFMGLDYRVARLLASQVFLPHKPKSCVCLGRPHYTGVNKETVRLCEEFGIPVSEELLAGEYRHRFADGLLKAFGIERLDHMDVFTEEGATIMHDLNRPVPDELRQRFDLIFDNGTLEHIFNVPQAIENCAAMCSVGGHVVMVGPANNMCGHGFFQFSPELFFRTFCEDNGFSDAQVLLLEYGVRNRDFKVIDPALKKERLEFINSSLVVMVGIARKQRHKEPFWTEWPQQSDYVAYWEEAAKKGKEKKLIGQASKLEVLLLNNFPRLSRTLQGIKFSGWNPRFKLRSNE